MRTSVGTIFLVEQVIVLFGGVPKISKKKLMKYKFVLTLTENNHLSINLKLQ